MTLDPVDIRLIRRGIATGATYGWLTLAARAPALAAVQQAHHEIRSTGFAPPPLLTLRVLEVFERGVPLIELIDVLVTAELSLSDVDWDLLDRYLDRLAEAPPG
jgi:hypothetical protein